MTPHDIITKQKIELAIMNQRVLMFDYVAKNLEVSRDRIFEPIEIKTNKDGIKQIVMGNDMEAEDVRAFSFEGIQKLKVMSLGELMDFYCKGGEE